MSGMKLLNSFRFFSIVLICAALVCVATAPAAETRDAQSVLNSLRLKKWTKDLQLTADQQKKVQAILEDEGKEIAKLDSAQLSINDRRVKVEELHDVTYTKIKPLLNETQLAKFEKGLPKPKK